MSFYNDLEKLKETRHSFCVPAHKGRAMPRELYSLDLTEQPQSDNAADPKGALRESERLCGELFSSGDTLFSTFGCSTAIKAALGYCVGYKGDLLAALPAHRALADAAALFGIKPHFIESINNRIDPQKLREKLNSIDVGTVFFTYTDYDGNILNLPHLLSVCRENGVKVIVDNAHGGYIRFLPKSYGFAHPISLGADMVIDSGSKTLGMLTPAALLHLKDRGATAEVRRFLNLLSSTSPPYPVMYSMDKAVHTLMTKELDFAGTAERTVQMKLRYRPYLIENDEPCKIVFSPLALNLDPENIAQILQEYSIMPELCNVSRVLFMTSPYNNEGDFIALQNALDNIFIAAKQTGLSLPRLPLPKIVGDPFSVLRHIQRTVSVREAVGHISADTVAPCPPGTVVLFAGQRIEKEHIETLILAGVERVGVTDLL